MSILVAIFFGGLAGLGGGAYARKRRELRELRQLLQSGVVCQCGHLECVHTDEVWTPTSAPRTGCSHVERACHANDAGDQPRCQCRRFSPIGGLPQIKTRALELLP